MIARSKRSRDTRSSARSRSSVEMQPGADNSDLAPGLDTARSLPAARAPARMRPLVSARDMELSAALLADPFEAIRARCADVAARARHVRIDADALARCAARIPPAELGQVSGTVYPDLGGDPERIAAFAICLDALNFGSGWFPQLVKPGGRSGYRTVEAAVARRFAERGSPSSGELRVFDAARMTALLGQERAGPDVAQLMELYARSWRDLGDLVERCAGG